ncbi:MAG TPA: peptidylprolyl isomerase [Dehalococcoidia bacterium]
MFWTRGLILLGVAAVAGLVLACGSTLDESLTDLEVGDCVASPDSGAQEINSLDSIDCAEPGAIKVAQAFDLSGASWPGLGVIQGEVTAKCPATTAFTLYPTEDSWDNADDRAVICFVSADEDLATAAPTEGAAALTNDDCPDPTEEGSEATVKTYDSAPDQTIDPEKSYTALVHTERGDFTMTLRPDLAPQHVNSFVFLARDGYYDGVTFHRVLPGFVAQAGDPTGTGSGGPGYSLPAEFTTEVPYTEGVVGAARTNDPDSAGSQWFVTLGEASNLNGQYTVFAQVTDGMDVVKCITPRDPSSNPGAPPGDKIIGIEITES